MAAGGGGRAGAPKKESIYNWIKEEAGSVTKEKIYRSRFSTGAPPPVPYSEMTIKKRSSATIGRHVKGSVRPDRFLKAHSAVGAAGSGEKFARPEVVPRKPALPGREERPVYGIKSKKNFVVANALDNILSVPPKAPGEPDYLHKEDFGKRPAYLEDIRRELEEEKEHIVGILHQAELAAKGGGETVARELSDEERAELLEALKAKWDSVNARYQKITHQTISTSHSTVGQVRMKEDCERALAQLEKDIERLSVKGPIFVVDE